MGRGDALDAVGLSFRGFTLLQKTRWSFTSSTTILIFKDAPEGLFTVGNKTLVRYVTWILSFDIFVKPSNTADSSVWHDPVSSIRCDPVTWVLARLMEFKPKWLWIGRSLWFGVL